MKVLAPFFSVLASVVTIAAVLASVRWRHSVQDDVPLTPARKGLYVGAAIYLGMIALFVLLLLLLLVAPAIIQLFI